MGILRVFYYNDVSPTTYTSYSYGPTDFSQSTLSSGTKKGYTFINWYDSSSSGNIGINIVSWPILVRGGSTLYIAALWNKTPYTVTWDSNNGLPNTTSIAYYNTNLTLPTEPTKPTFAFGGWNDGSSIILSNPIYYIDSSNMTFTAFWTYSYSLNWNSNNIGTGIIIKVILNRSTKAPYMKAVGYNFIGWYNSINNGILSLNANDNYIMPASDVTFYAYWTDNSNVKFSNLQTTYGGSGQISISAYQAFISKQASTETKLSQDFKGKGPVPS